MIGMLVSCGDDSDTSLVGDWELIEILSDPGDGSGTYQSVDSDKILTFKIDGTVTSNGSLCDLSIDTEMMTSGTYSETDSTFKSADCPNPDFNYRFIQDGNKLTINFPCFEPCGARYKKL